MVTLEQVRQLETKIGKAIDYVSRVNAENIRLRGELEGSEKRLAGLEDTVRRFRDEQGRIEEGILAAMKRLDQFEDLISDGLSDVQAVVAAAAPIAPSRTTGSAEPDPAPSDEDPLGKSGADRSLNKDLLLGDSDTEEPFAKSPSAKPNADELPVGQGAESSFAGPLDVEPPYGSAGAAAPGDEPEDESFQAGETEELDIF
jgi:hypothetical protein